MDEVICGQDGVWFPFQWFDTVIGRQEGRPAYKKNSCWYSSGGGPTGALHVLDFRFTPLPFPEHV